VLMPTILVIEDDRNIREGLIDLLEVEGFTVVVAANGAEGVEKAHQHLPDLILSDVNMPRLDGFGVLTKVKSSPSTAAIPFVLMSATVGPEELEKGLMLGASDYLPKPFRVDVLLKTVEKALQSRVG
jgi:two-component system, sensor histidine kinase and response regulator